MATPNSRPNDRVIRSPRGPEKTAKTWAAEAAMRMLMNNLDPEVADLPIQRSTLENAKIDTVMSNSFGFGGTNATLVLKRWQG